MKTDLTIAKILKPRGLKGEMRIETYVSDKTQLCKVKEVKIDNTTYTIRQLSLDGVFGYIQLDGIDNVDKAEALRGKQVLANRNQLSLPKGKHYIVDLIGLNVVVAGQIVGEVQDVQQYGSADVYFVKTPNGSLSFPGIGNLILDVDLDNGYIKLDSILFNRVVVYN